MVEYDTFKLGIFESIKGMSRTLLILYLTKLSNDFNIPLTQVVQEYNEYTGYADYERIEHLGDDDN